MALDLPTLAVNIRAVRLAARRRGLAAVAVLVAGAASFVLALGAPQAQAVITAPIPADVGPVPPPIPTLPAAGGVAPPADVITDPVEPAASCGGWAQQDLYAGAWPAGSSWWEYRCTYKYPPPCSGACNADWYPSVWTDYFYWDGSKPVFYGEFYGDYYYGSGCDYWWDQPTAAWYVFDTAACPFSGPGNAAPTAEFSFNCSGLACSFDASGSWATDGIAAYRWDFGDGTNASGITASHSYAATGSYHVTLTVTDSGGLRSANRQTVATTDIPPTARFTFSCTGLTCSFDGSASADPDGTIRQYSWSFGDGYSALGSSAENTYAQAGSYTVRLDVTDDAGLDAVSEQTVTVVGTSTDIPPTASFSFSCSGLSCHFDGSGSSDSDGTIVAYQWDFGDYSGASVSAPTFDHTYLQAGSYSVTLRVIDTGKQSATSGPQTVTVTNVPPTARFSVSCSALTCSFDGTGSSDSDGTINSYWWNFGDGSPLGVGSTATHTYAQNGSYSVTLTVIDNGGLNATATKTVSVGPNTPPSAAFTVSCTGLSCSFDGSSSTDSDGTIASYSWAFGDGATASGATATHTYGHSGTYSASLTVTDDRGASTTVSKDVAVTNLAPTAAFTVTCSGLHCTLDASRSTDPDGTIDSYGWSFGDGGGGSLTTTSTTHDYAKAGNYTVTLTVTDNDGANASTSQRINPISLSARAYKQSGQQKVDLAWNGVTGTTFDVFRNGVKIFTLSSTAYTDTVAKGSGTYKYKVCDSASATCSNEATVSF
jgi:PKD repeat protein